MVTVVEVDLPRKRIALSMKANPEIRAASPGKTAPAPQRPPGARPPAKPAAPTPVDWFTEALKKAEKPGN